MKKTEYINYLFPVVQSKNLCNMEKMCKFAT